MAIDGGYTGPVTRSQSGSLSDLTRHEILGHYNSGLEDNVYTQRISEEQQNLNYTIDEPNQSANLIISSTAKIRNRDQKRKSMYTHHQPTHPQTSNHKRTNSTL